MTRILIDMDGPSADWSGGIERYFRDQLLPTGDLDWSRWNGVKEGSESVTLPRVREAQASVRFYRDLPRVWGVKGAVLDMEKAGYEVFFCSTPDETNPTCADDKIAWLEENFGSGWGKRLILTHDKTLISGDILIDDKPEITGVATPSWEHIVWDAPYNQPEPGDPRIRLDAWSDWKWAVGLSIVQRSEISGTLNEQIATTTKGEVRAVSSTGGEKGVKPQRYDLIPVYPMDLLAELYGNGAAKYAAHNWRLGYEWSNSYAAAMRHMTRFWAGEDIDPEMQVQHVICAAFHMFALAQFMKDAPQFDDRYKPSVEQDRRIATKVGSTFAAGGYTGTDAGGLIGVVHQASYLPLSGERIGEQAAILLNRVIPKAAKINIIPERTTA